MSQTESQPQPQLRRVLTRTDLIVYGLTIITPMAPTLCSGLCSRFPWGTPRLAI